MTNNILTGGMFAYGISAFFLPISNELGWSRAAMSAPIGVSRLEGGLLGPVEGYLVDKFGTRKLIFFGVIVMGTCFILLSRMQSLSQFYLIFILKGLASGFIMVGLTVAVVNWFKKRRALGLSFVMGGVNVGAMVVPLIVWLIATQGWRGTAFIVGLTMLAVQLPLSLIIRHRPEQYGYLPDGMSEEQAKAAEAESERESALAEQNFTPWQAVRTPTLWFICIVYAIRALVVPAIAIHLIPFIQDLGYSAATGAIIMAIMGLSALIGRVVMGYLADIIPKRYAYAATLAGLVISMLIMSRVRSLWQLILWAVLYGPSYGGGMPIMSAMVGDYYGRKFFGTINGITHIFMAVTSLAGPIFAGYIFDVTGSYRLAFVSFAAVLVIGIPFAILARRPRLPALLETVP